MNGQECHCSSCALEGIGKGMEFERNGKPGGRA